MSRIAVVLVAAISVVTGACEKKNPVAPTIGANVTIIGSVTAPVPSGLTVSAGGSSGTAQVDGAGQFTLANAPSGSVDLRFTGGGTAASLRLANVQPDQTITIVVSISGTSATLESSRRVLGNNEEVEGTVETVTPPSTLVVAGRTVSTAGSTTMTLNGQAVQFDVLAPAQRVLVRGQATSQALMAQSIEILTAVVVGNLNVSGTVTVFSGTRSSFQFTVGSTQIQADGSTTFDSTSAFNELGNGLTVQVTGAQQQGYVYATKIQITSPKTTAFGRIIDTNGTAPQLVLTLPSQTVMVSAVTDVRRKGDPQDAGTIVVGQTIDVSGRQMQDGTVVASSLNILTDSAGGHFMMTGTVTAITGTCPDIRITASGYTITTASSTTFTGVACAGLVAGDRVEIDGVVQPDFSVAATSIKKI